MSEMEFGADVEFGADAPPVVSPRIEDDPVALKTLVEELTKQIAATMDPEEQTALRSAKKAAEEQLAKFNTASKTERQWTELSKAFFEAYGNKDEFQKQLGALGGISDEAYFEMNQNLAKFHAAQKPEKTTRRSSKKALEIAAKVKAEEEYKAAHPGPTPEERWPHILEHAKKCGMDGNIIFDELGFKELTHETVNAVLAEVNKRANPEPEEEFGSGESGNAATATGTPSIPAVSAPSSPSTPKALHWDEVLNRLVDPETGAVVTRGYFLEALGWPELPQELTKEQVDEILDLMHTRFIDPAKRYREQAEKRAKPLEQKAKLWDDAFGALLDKYAEGDGTGKDGRLPRYQSDSKEGTKDPHKKGDFSKKSLDFASGSISWRGDSGGPTCVNPPVFFAWLEERKNELLALKEAGDAEQMAAIKEQAGVTLKTTADFDKSIATKFLPPGWEDVKPNPLKTREIK